MASVAAANAVSENEGSDYEQPAAYQSSDEDKSEVENDEPAKTKRTIRSWGHKATFETSAEALEWVKGLKVWTSYTQYDTDSGRKKVYRCNCVPKRGPQCAAGLYLLFHDDSNQVTAFETKSGHTHDEILETRARIGFNQETKDFISALLDKKVTQPKNIFDALASEAEKNKEIQVPKNERQLYNYLSHFKKKEGNYLYIFLIFKLDLTKIVLFL